MNLIESIINLRLPDCVVKALKDNHVEDWVSLSKNVNIQNEIKKLLKPVQIVKLQKLIQKSQSNHDDDAYDDKKNSILIQTEKTSPREEINRQYNYELQDLDSLTEMIFNDENKAQPNLARIKSRLMCSRNVHLDRLHRLHSLLRDEKKVVEDHNDNSYTVIKKELKMKSQSKNKTVTFQLENENSAQLQGEKVDESTVPIIEIGLIAENSIVCPIQAETKRNTISYFSELIAISQLLMVALVFPALQSLESKREINLPNSSHNASNTITDLQYSSTALKSPTSAETSQGNVRSNDDAKSEHQITDPITSEADKNHEAQTESSGDIGYTSSCDDSGSRKCTSQLDYPVSESPMIIVPDAHQQTPLSSYATDTTTAKLCEDFASLSIADINEIPLHRPQKFTITDDTIHISKRTAPAHNEDCSHSVPTINKWSDTINQLQKPCGKHHDTMDSRHQDIDRNHVVQYYYEDKHLFDSNGYSTTTQYQTKDSSTESKTLCSINLQEANSIIFNQSNETLGCHATPSTWRPYNRKFNPHNDAEVAERSSKICQSYRNTFSNRYDQRSTPNIPQPCAYDAANKKYIHDDMKRKARPLATQTSSPSSPEVRFDWKSRHDYDYLQKKKSNLSFTPPTTHDFSRSLVTIPYYSGQSFSPVISNSHYLNYDKFHKQHRLFSWRTQSHSRYERGQCARKDRTNATPVRSAFGNCAAMSFDRRPECEYNNCNMRSHPCHIRDPKHSSPRTSRKRARDCELILPSKHTVGKSTYHKKSSKQSASTIEANRFSSSNLVERSSRCERRSSFQQPPTTLHYNEASLSHSNNNPQCLIKHFCPDNDEVFSNQLHISARMTDFQSRVAALHMEIAKCKALLDSMKRRSRYLQDTISTLNKKRCKYVAGSY